ncbi:MAG: ATP-binding cassette domain-containing protein [Actinobacteria bacterium]|nr:ATP-binding cassette domain-containing protein [Actinomycetota bacterium]
MAGKADFVEPVEAIPVSSNGHARVRAWRARADVALANPNVRFGQWVAAGLLGFLGLVGFVFPTPTSVLFLGAILGMLSALVALGIVLVYRANRIINFAAGDLGAVAGVLAVSLIVGPKWPFWPSLFAGLAAGVAMGAVVEFLFVRRFSRSPRLILTVATIGIATIMQGLQLIVPTWFGYDIAPQDFPQPFSWTMRWDPLIFRGGHLMVLLAVPLIGAGLAAFFRFTRWGRAVRASAESADRALLLGIPVRRIGTLVWVLAATLSALASVLRAPIVGVPIGQVLGPALLLRALAAAVIGRMENLTVTFFAAIGLGMIEQAVFWDTGRTLFADAVLFAVIMAALLIQRRHGARAEDTGRSTWEAVREIRPIPPELRNTPEVKWGLAGAAGAAGLFLVLYPLTLGPGRVNLFSFGVLTAMLGTSLIVLTGWAGQISLGQWAFAGVGGAVAGTMAQHEWNILIALLVAAVVGAAVSIALGIPSLRIRGPFLAVATLSFALASNSYFLNREFFGWVPQPGRITRPELFGKFDLESEYTFYFFVLVLFGLVLVAVRSMRRSRAGRVILAGRENERGAQAFGVSVMRSRLVAFAAAGFIAALMGAILVFHQHTMFDSPLRPENSLRLFSIVVFGGLGSVTGVLISAAFFTFFDFFVKTAEVRLITSGAGLLLVLLAFPGGVGQIVYDTRDRLLRGVARRRGIVVPSLVADLRVDDEGNPVVDVDADSDERRESSGWVQVIAAVRRALTWRPRARAGPTPSAPAGTLLQVRGLDVAYGQTQVLFGVDFDVREGEILALLGTNGAGKSTLLNAVAGIVEARAGSVMFQGRDITATPANRTVAEGVVLVPGGRGVFPTLTVEENLDLAGWLFRRDPEHVVRAREFVLDAFPILRERWNQRAGNLSGGEQQMLTLGQAFIARPKLLMIDELSLGLAPVLVEQLLEIVRAIHAQGTTVVLVEQSVNVAVTLADRAVFMEKGEVRFDGPTAGLLERPDLLRAVFLGGAASRDARANGGAGMARARARARHGDHGHFVEACEVCGREARTALDVREVSVGFGGIRAVDGVSFTVREGEIVGIIGPNGAGKTTLFDAISGFVPTVTGRVLLGDADVTGLSPDTRAMRGLGRSFQDARLFPALTVYENIAVGFERHVPTRDALAAFVGSPATRASERVVRERVEGLIELMSLQAYANKFVSELSTGTRRVVDLASVLAHEPTVLLLDEPSSGIAQRETEALGPLLLDIRARTGAGLVVIEHDMPLITAVSDRLIALDLGRVIAEGSPRAVTRDPLVVESYLGSSEEVIRRSGQQAGRARVRRGTAAGRRR